MALNDLILNKGEIVVILSDSTLGLVSDEIGLNFGIVQSINDLCDLVTVGQSVWFDIKNAVPFMVISGQKFYKLREEHISGTEPLL
jgi:hypothetical protein